jgi:hypothetical protein
VKGAHAFHACEELAVERLCQLHCGKCAGRRKIRSRHYLWEPIND